MNFKKILAYILAAFLGLLIVGLLTSLIEVIPMTIYTESINFDILYPVYLLIGSLSLGLGIYLGTRSYNKKNVWYEIFKPSKNKIIISLILSCVLIVITISIGGGKTFISTYSFQPVSRFVGILSTLISYFIYFYPFSAICQFIYSRHQDEIFKNSKIAIIILLILLNPIFVFFSGMVGFIYRTGILYEPCGVKVVAFYEPSPAIESGLQVNEIIVGVNNVEIDTTENLTDFMSNINSDNILTFRTKGREYKIKPVYKDDKYILGVNLTQEICRRSIIK